MAKWAVESAIYLGRQLGTARGSSQRAPWPCSMAGGGLLAVWQGTVHQPNHTGLDPLALDSTHQSSWIEAKLKRRKFLFSALSLGHFSNRLSGENILTNTDVIIHGSQ